MRKWPKYCLDVVKSAPINQIRMGKGHSRRPLAMGMKKW